MNFLLAAATALFIPSLAQAADTVRLCTGTPNGIYYAAGLEIQKVAGRNVTVEVLPSKGAIDNKERTLDVPATAADACDAMIGQGDAPTYFAKKEPAAARKLKRMATLHDEYGQFLCGKKSGITDIKQLLDNPSKYSIAIGGAGSGSWIMWQNFIAENPDYAKVRPTDEADVLALADVASGETTCMLLVAGLGHGTMREADSTYGADVALVEATDWSFNNAKDMQGEPIYTFADIPTGTYPLSLQSRHWSGTETVKMPAAVFVNPERVTGNALRAFVEAANRASIAVKATYNK